MAKDVWVRHWTIVFLFFIVSKAVVCNDTSCDVKKQSTASQHHEVAMAGQKFFNVPVFCPRKSEEDWTGSIEWSE